VHYILFGYLKDLFEWDMAREARKFLDSGWDLQDFLPQRTQRTLRFLDRINRTNRI